MAHQARKDSTRDRHEDTTDEAVTGTPAADGAVEDGTVDALDVLLGEIDGILEENAEKFVADYVQRGGQ